MAVADDESADAAVRIDVIVWLWLCTYVGQLVAHVRQEGAFDSDALQQGGHGLVVTSESFESARPTVVALQKQKDDDTPDWN